MKPLLAALLLVPAAERPEKPVSFVHDVLPALTKQGCNAGSCHGSPTGKGGFRLSLRGYDASLDQLTLMREVFSRRTNVLNPEDSLLLLKPLMRVPHEGGQKLRVTDPAYTVLRRWVAEGCRFDLDASACVRIEVSPNQKTLHWPQRTQQLAVRAHFADGSNRDITHLADFSSSDEVVAEVNRAGIIKGCDRGEAAIIVRYAEHVAICSFTQLKEVPGFEWPKLTPNNHIDELVFDRLKRLRLPPSPLCSDSEFLRRLYLDVLGILPSIEETRQFLADHNSDKRSKLIDKVLERPEYAEYWAHRWGDLLQVKAGKLSKTGAEKMHAWLHEAGRTNMPFDRFARSLLTAKGSTFTNPPASFFRTSADASSRAENTAQLFLGARIQCAKCHNHPGDTWTQDGYHGIASFFARVEQKAGTGGEVIVSTGNKGEIIQPLSLKTAKPMLPGVGVITIAEDKDRRDVFADWLTKHDNPTFAKVAVNRIWGHLMGRGIVDPVDDFRVSNPPAHPELLDRLASDFIRDGYDQKKLMRTILQSRVYQLSSRALPLNQNDNRYFSHGYARLLPAEVLLDSICQVTGSHEVYPGRRAGTRAVQLPGPEGENPFLKTFGQPGRDTSCACERSQEPKLSQPLELLGGGMLHRKLRHSSGRIGMHLDDLKARLAAAGQPPREGLALWLDASRGVNGSRVSEWQDQSGKGHHVKQPNPPQQPMLVPGVMAGLPAVRFDGKDDFLHNTVINLLPAGSPRTVMIAGRADGPGGALFSFRRQSAGGKPVFVVQHGVYQGNYYVYTDGINGAGNSTLPIAHQEMIRQPFLSVHQASGAGKKLVVRLNGEPKPVTQPGAVGKDEGSTGFVVGNREDVGDFGWGGDISEVLVYDRVLEAKELEQAERYLATRYNLPAKQRIVVPVKSADQTTEADRRLITELFLAAFCREPKPAELKTLMDHLSEMKDRRAGLEDIFWAVLNAKEFLFRP